MLALNLFNSIFNRTLNDDYNGLKGTRYPKKHMPYKRRTRRFRKKTTRKSTKGLALKAYKMVKKINRNFEKKFNTNSFNSTINNTLQAVLSGNLIAQGDLATQRNGNAIYVKGIRLRFNMFASGNTDDIAQVRIIVLRDYQTANDTYPAVADVLADPSNIVSPYNYPNNYKRFKILYDKIFPLNATGITYNTATGNTIVYNPARFKQVWLWPKTRILFNGGSSADVQKNGIWVYAMASGSGTMNLNMTSQTCFTDN